MAVYANENGSLKDLTSVLNLGNNFIINGIDYIGQTNCSATNTAYTITISKGITAYKYFIFVFSVPKTLTLPAITFHVLLATDINGLTASSSVVSSTETLKMTVGVTSSTPHQFILFRKSNTQFCLQSAQATRVVDIFGIR